MRVITYFILLMLSWVVRLNGSFKKDKNEQIYLVLGGIFQMLSLIALILIVEVV